METNPIKKKSNQKPWPVDLGNMKPVLQAEAFEQDRSLSWLLRKVIKSYYETVKDKHLPKKPS